LTDVTAPAAMNGSPDWNFDHLDISQGTTTYDIPLIGKDARLMLRPALEMNEDYLDALLATSGRRERLMRGASSSSTDDDREQDRQDDIDLFPGNVVIGWENVPNKQGNLVPFTLQNCRTFIKRLPRWLFDRIRGHCRIAENFIDEEHIPPSAVGDIVGN